jgi:hypothetical protein
MPNKSGFWRDQSAIAAVRNSVQHVLFQRLGQERRIFGAKKNRRQKKKKSLERAKKKKPKKKPKKKKKNDYHYIKDGGHPQSDPEGRHRRDRGQQQGHEERGDRGHHGRK